MIARTEVESAYFLCRHVKTNLLSQGHIRTVEMYNHQYTSFGMQEQAPTQCLQSMTIKKQKENFFIKEGSFLIIQRLSIFKDEQRYRNK